MLRWIAVVLVLFLFGVTGLGLDRVHRHHHRARIDRVHTIHRAAMPVWHKANVVVTAYVVNAAERGKCAVYTNRTASGTVAREGTIAVDTSRFRFGTKFIIPGYGHGTATDTGGAIIGNKLDVAMLSCHQAFQDRKSVV